MKVPGETRYVLDGVAYDEAEVVEEYRAFVSAMRPDLQSITSWVNAENHGDADVALDHTNLAEYLDTRGAGRYALTLDGPGGPREVNHDAVVFALPFSTLRQVHLDASLNLPPWKRYAISNLVYGTNTKTMIGFDSRPWVEQHGNGSVYGLMENLQNVWETNPANATDTRAVITDYGSGVRGAGLDPARVQAQAEAFLRDLDRVYPGAAAAATRLADGSLRAHLEHWPSRPTHRGSYTCNHPGYFTTICDNEGRSVEGLFFAGEHADSFHEWQGFMEGACNSGLAAAKAIVHAVRSQQL